MRDQAETHEVLLQFFHQAPIGLVQTTLKGDVTLMNPMATQLLLPLAPGGTLDNLFDALHAAAPGLKQQLDPQGREPGVLCDGLRLPGVAADGRTLSLKLLKASATTLMASLSDISAVVELERQQLAQRLEQAAHTDSLTALPNRVAARERIAAAMARAEDSGEPFAVLFLNCDRFKRINDSWGRAVGDALLRLVANRLKGALRHRGPAGRGAGRDRLVARLGVDEFVVLLEGVRNTAHVESVAERLIQVLGKPYAIEGHVVHASVSIGVFTARPSHGDADTVLQDASLAMHEAKRAGGARWCRFEPHMQERAARRGSVEDELRTAIAAGQLFVVYQPLLSLGDGAVTGVEALVRWRHPLRGIVPPIEFIDIAEETGLIGPLGEFVLNEACRQFTQWQRSLGPRAPRHLSVNLSRAQLGDARLTEQVAQALASSGMAGPCLQLEVTESLAAQDEQVQYRLHELKALGLTLALDDFGTGYSSLSSLHLLPVDVVKIDRSFVSQSETSAHHRVLIEATVRVARSLRMGTLAEGIETEGQAQVLRRLHCDEGQGYLFSRPLEADAATRWLADRPAPRSAGGPPVGRRLIGTPSPVPVHLLPK